MSVRAFSWLKRTRLIVALVIAAITVLAVTTPAGAATQQTVETYAYSTADPGVTLYNGNFYAFTTSTASGTPTAGFGLWESKAPEASGVWKGVIARANLPASTPSNQFASGTPSWIKSGSGVWAPDMVYDPADSDFLVYFSVAVDPSQQNTSGSPETPAGGAQCIGVAISKTTSTSTAPPTGPFMIAPNPVVCFDGYGAADDMTPATPGNRVLHEGAIDPDPVIINNSWDDDTNELFLLYKTQSSTGQATIRMVRLDMTTDGTTELGTSHELLAAISTGSSGYVPADTIEAPSLLPLSNGDFVLFVAHGDYAGCGYSTEWFESQHPWSWTQSGGTTILDQSSTDLCGPGGASVTGSEVAGQYRLFFHAYENDTAGTVRQMYADVLTIGSDGYTPTLTPLAPAS
jgi:hypothetical protein